MSRYRIGTEEFESFSDAEAWAVEQADAGRLHGMYKIEPIEPMLHDLKTWPEYFKPVAGGAKTLELRRADRAFQIGHILLLREWEPTTQAYTGRSVRALVTHIVRDHESLQPGYVAMSIQVIE